MLFVSHLMGGLIVGKLSGSYTIALLGSLAPDLDHIYSYFKGGLLSKPSKMIKTMLSHKDIVCDQRNYLHSLFVWAGASIFLIMINNTAGAVFSIAYLVHLLMDALDGSEFYPFYPFKTMNSKGPIEYSSKKEMAFLAALILIFFFV